MRTEISAGGVVYRECDRGIEIQLIRDRFGKMTLAKGKMEPGETIEQTALREIEEETGIAGKIVESLQVIAYEYEHAEYGKVLKEVHYYLVEAGDDRLQAQIEEISGVDWYEPNAAWQLQRESGYGNNDEVLGLAFDKLGLKRE